MGIISTCLFPGQVFVVSPETVYNSLLIAVPLLLILSQRAFSSAIAVRKRFEKIVIDAKNYQDKRNYADSANTVEYLINPQF